MQPEVMVTLDPELSTSQKLHCPTTYLSLIYAHANQPTCAEKMHVHIICNIYIFIGLNATTIEGKGTCGEDNIFIYKTNENLIISLPFDQPEHH